jgi:hypothetical protein
MSVPVVDNDDVFLDIMPGILTVHSSYHIDEVNELMTKIIRLCLAVCLMQCLNAIVEAILWFYIEVVIFEIFNIFLFWLVYRCSVMCVEQKNERVCGCCQSLTLLRIYLGISIFFLLLATLRYLTLILSKYEVAIMTYYFFLNLMLLGLTTAASTWSARLSSVLNNQVHAAPTVVAASATVNQPPIAHAVAVEV